MTGPARGRTTAPALQPTDVPHSRARVHRKPISMVGTGIVGGVTAMLCCVGPTVLALLGVISATTAFSFATDLYDNWAWLFRLAGLLAVAGIVWWGLRRRRACSLRGVRQSWKRLVGVVAIAVGTYVLLYIATTLLGQLS